METLPLNNQSTMSLEDFSALPEGPPYYELEDGELIEMNRPTPRHQRVLLKLAMVIEEHISTHGLGRLYPEVNVEFSQNKVYTPDLVFYTTENVRNVDEYSSLTQPPMLVVEILSPSTTMRDTTRKLKTYCEAGVAWYWLIDPEQLTIIEYHLAESGRYEVTACVETGQAFRPGIFEGLEIDLAALMGGNPT
jgi:Uma2 family endonuclease